MFAKTAALVVLVLTLPMGCARHERLPVSHADPAPTEGEEDIDPESEDPFRVELRHIHAACDERVVELREGVEDADRRENILTAVAALAYVVGRIAGGGRNAAAAGGLYGPGSTQSYRCTEGPNGTSDGVGCTFQPQPSRALGEGGPIDQQTDQVHLDAADQVREINRGVDALDDFLFSNPDPDAWTEADRAHFEQLSEALRAACH